MYILGYLPKENRVYLGDKDVSVTSYSLPLSVLEYQTAVMRKDFDTADKYLPQIPDNQRTRVARFLEKQVSGLLLMAVLVLTVNHSVLSFADPFLGTYPSLLGTLFKQDFPT